MGLGGSILRPTTSQVVDALRSAGKLPWEGAGGGGGGAAPALQAVGMSGFTTGNYYRTAADSEPKGTAPGFSVGVVFRQDAAIGTEVIFAGGALTTTGWALWSLTGGIQFRCANGAGSGVASSSYTIGTGQVGSVFRVVGVHTGTHLRLYVNGAQVGTDQAITGYTPVNAANRIGIGVRGSAITPLTNGTVVGCIAANATALSGAQIATWDAAVQAAASCVSFPAGTTHRWQVEDAGDPFAATWTDDVGSIVMDKTGTLTRSAFTPTWAT